MSTKLYNEAIAEAKKLRAVAEANATKKILESVAPKIRMLIEQELDADEELEDTMNDMPEEIDDSFDDESLESAPSVDMPMEEEPKGLMARRG